MKRYYIVYKGIVQGVGFRYRIAMLARKYNLTGYVRNLDNGDVDCEIQGNGLDDFLRESLGPDRFIKIWDYSIKELPIKEDERKFSVKY